MYASSLIIPMKKIEMQLEKVESYSDFNNSKSISVGRNTLAMIEDWSTQIEHAISRFNLLQSDCKTSSQIIDEILTYRYTEGHEKDEGLEQLNIEYSSPRIKLVNDYILVPIDTTSSGLKNWHQTVQKLNTEFPSIIELSGRVHQRSTTAIEDINETVYWIIHNKLKCLQRTINEVYYLQKYMTEYFNQDIFRVIERLGEIVNNVSKVNSNA